MKEQVGRRRECGRYKSLVVGLGLGMTRALHSRLVLPHETGAQDLSDVFRA